MTEPAPAESARPDLVRIALHRDVTRDDIDDAMCARGWLLVQMVAPTDEHPAQSIFLTQDRTGILYYVEDGHIDASYFVVRGPDLDRMTDEVRASLRWMSRDELLATTSSDDEAEVTRAVLLLAIVTLERDDEVLAVLERTSARASSRIRDAVAIARRSLGAEPREDEACPSPPEAGDVA